MLNMLSGMLLVASLSQPAPEKIAIAFNERGDVITSCSGAKCAEFTDHIKIPHGEIAIIAIIGDSQK